MTENTVQVQFILQRSPWRRPVKNGAIRTCSLEKAFHATLTLMSPAAKETTVFFPQVLSYVKRKIDLITDITNSDKIDTDIAL